MEFSELENLMRGARSYRRFRETQRVGEEDLRQVVELTRYTPSGRNMQPLKYRVIADAEMCEKLFPLLGWAGYLRDWPGPERGERPAAYIVQCLDLSLTKDAMCDDGIQLEAITLGLASKGLGSCIIKSFDAHKLSATLGFGDNLMPLHVVALGVPAERVVIEAMKDGDIRYWRDSNQIHHVPKRSIDEILLN